MGRWPLQGCWMWMQTCPNHSGTPPPPFTRDVATPQSGLSLAGQGWLCYTCSFWLIPTSSNKWFKCKWSLSPLIKQSATVCLKTFSMQLSFSFFFLFCFFLTLPDFKYVLFFNLKIFFHISYSAMATIRECVKNQVWLLLSKLSLVTTSFLPSVLHSHEDNVICELDFFAFFPKNN